MSIQFIMFENCFRNAVVSSNWTPELDSFLLAMLSDDFASILLDFLLQ